MKKLVDALKPVIRRISTWAPLRVWAALNVIISVFVAGWLCGAYIGSHVVLFLVVLLLILSGLGMVYSIDTDGDPSTIPPVDPVDETV